MGRLKTEGSPQKTLNKEKHNQLGLSVFWQQSGGWITGIKLGRKPTWKLWYPEKGF
jgi:hypothetical protein